MDKDAETRFFEFVERVNTMMSLSPEFAKATVTHMIETTPPLRAFIKAVKEASSPMLLIFECYDKVEKEIEARKPANVIPFRKAN